MSHDEPEAAPPASASPDGPGTSEPTGIINLNETQRIPTGDGRQERQGVPERADAPDRPAAPERGDALAPAWGAGGATASGTAAAGTAVSGTAAAGGTAAAQSAGPAPAAGEAAEAGPAASGSTSWAAPEAATAWNAPEPVAPPTAPGPRQGASRRRTALGLAALCLASGLAGGVGGALLTDRADTTAASIPVAPGSTARPAGSVAQVAASVVPGVVTIKVQGSSAQDQGTGSGFVIDDKGHILTNNHVIASVVDEGDIEVMNSAGETMPAKLIGHDTSYDLAVIKVDRTDLPPLTMGASSGVVVGDPVIAVGAPLGLDQTVTTGIISALDRPVTPGTGDEASYINALQTDAAINPGNSGGPLLNMQGQVIGVNSAIARVPGSASSTGGNIGLGFAIPSDQARRTAEQLITTGKATYPIIGVMLDRTYADTGAKVSDDSDGVTPGGPAAQAGIEPGDVIIGFDGKLVRTPDQLVVSIRSRAVGEKVTLRIERDGQEREVEMTLQAAPAG